MIDTKKLDKIDNNKNLFNIYYKSMDEMKTFFETSIEEVNKNIMVKLNQTDKKNKY